MDGWKCLHSKVRDQWKGHCSDWIRHHLMWWMNELRFDIRTSVNALMKVNSIWLTVKDALGWNVLLWTENVTIFNSIWIARNQCQLSHDCIQSRKRRIVLRDSDNFNSFHHWINARNYGKFNFNAYAAQWIAWLQICTQHRSTHDYNIINHYFRVTGVRSKQFN